MQVDRMVAYLKAKGFSYFLPALSGNTKLLGALIDKLKDGAVAKRLETMEAQDPEKRQKSIDSMEMFFEMVRRNLPRLSPNTQRNLAFNMFFNHLTLGQEVRILVNELQDAGTYTLRWDGRDNVGRDVAAGVYFYRLNAGSHEFIKKMVLLK